MNRRDFTKYFIAAAAVFLPNHSVVGAVRHRYQLASESILPEGLRALLTRFVKPTASQSPTGIFFATSLVIVGAVNRGIPAMPLATLKTAHCWTSQNSTR